MKKILIVLILLSGGKVFAQGQWWPIKLKISIPSKTERTVYLDTSFKKDSLNRPIDFLKTNYLKNYRSAYYQIQDSISMSWSSGEQKLSFSLDTVSQRLKNLSFENGWYHEENPTDLKTIQRLSKRFIFSELQYKRKEDTIIISSSGTFCKSALNSAIFDSAFLVYYSPPQEQTKP